MEDQNQGIKNDVETEEALGKGPDKKNCVFKVGPEQPVTYEYTSM